MVHLKKGKIMKKMVMTLGAMLLLAGSCVFGDLVSKSGAESQKTKQVSEKRLKAGIIPYCVDSKTNDIKLLLAKGPHKHKCLGGTFTCSMDKWADFGGSVEQKDLDHHANKDDAIKETAAREAHEETMGYFTREPGLDARSKAATEKGIAFWMGKLKEENRVRTAAGYDYWFVEIPCTATQTAELRELHNQMLSKAGSNSSVSIPWVGGAYFLWKIDADIEKSDFRWVPAQYLLERMNKNEPMKINDPENPSKGLDLYYRFVQSLKEGKDVLARIVNENKKEEEPKLETKPVVKPPVKQSEKDYVREEVNRIAGFKKQVLVETKDPAAVKPVQGDSATITFTSWLGDENNNKGKKIASGKAGVIIGKHFYKGFNEALASMKVGEKSRIILAPGSLGEKEEKRLKLPPQAIVIYEIELNSIKRAKKS